MGLSYAGYVKMEINLMVLGLIFDIIGVGILVLVNIFGVHHGHLPQEKWTKRYWWIGWCPILRISPPDEKARWEMRLKHKRSRDGAIPPMYQWNIIGFLYIGIGFSLQILGNLR